MTPPSIVVSISNPLMRPLIQAHLRNLGAFVNAADSQGQAKSMISAGSADLVLFDLLIGNSRETHEFIEFARKTSPGIGLIILTSIPEPRLVGIDASKFPRDLAYISTGNPAALAQLGPAVQEALRGKYPRDYRQHLNARHALTDLSNSQLGVLIAISRGLSNQEIAKERGTTVRAVENLIKRALEKLSIAPDPSRHSRVMAMRLYAQTIGGQLPGQPS